MYHNDGRHYYTYVFDSPIKLHDALMPVDEVAGTAVDTLTFLVERGDGMFYDSKVGFILGKDKRPFNSATMWHVWESLQSLIARGLDPLKIVIDRAHEKGMDFFPVVRLASYGGLDPALKPEVGGKGFLEKSMRDHRTAVIRELVHDYEIDGLEIDFPGLIAKSKRFYFLPEDIEQGKAVMTEWLHNASRLVRSGGGREREVGARVFPTEQMNLDQGLDVRAWLEAGLLDYVIPQLFGDQNTDPDMPLEWLVELAHEHGVSVYGNIQPFIREDATLLDDHMAMRWVYPTPENFRAVMSNYWAKGVDGLCTWFMKWPLDIEQRAVLTEIGDRDLIAERNKRYTLRRRNKYAAEMGYDAPLPVRISQADPAQKYEIPFFIGDDIQSNDRIRQLLLRVHVSNVVTQDMIAVWLNGESLENEVCLRDYARRDATRDQWLEFHLQAVRPRKGDNMLEVALEARPEGLIEGVAIEEVEIVVEYGPHPNGLFPNVTA